MYCLVYDAPVVLIITCILIGCAIFLDQGALIRKIRALVKSKRIEVGLRIAESSECKQMQVALF